MDRSKKVIKFRIKVYFFQNLLKRPLSTFHKCLQMTKKSSFTKQKISQKNLSIENLFTVFCESTREDNRKKICLAF